MNEIFFVSFLIALTGALSPGPVLTFTIYRSLKSKKGYLAGLFISLGHATLEFALIIALLLGASIFLQNIIILTIIGAIGSILLIIFGVFVIWDVYKKPIESNVGEINENDMKGFKGNSFFGGIFFSFSNPYWILWWAMIGLGLMIEFNISFENPTGLLLFYFGHILGDFIWYVPLSIFISSGVKFLKSKLYRYILIISGLFMIIIGLYLGGSIIIFSPEI